jgi:hypothetical protein
MESSVEDSKAILEEDAVVMATGGERGDDKVVGGVVITDEVDETYSSESDEGVWYTALSHLRNVALNAHSCFVGGGNHNPCRENLITEETATEVVWRQSADLHPARCAVADCAKHTVEGAEGVGQQPRR